MEKKNSFSITLAGKPYKLCGEESSEYLSRVGSYIEGKYAKFSSEISFRTLPMDMQHVLLQLNIADDYFKCMEELSLSMRKQEEQAQELEKMKSSLVAMQVKYDNLETSAKMIEKKYQESKDKINKLENRLKNKTN